jgi:hypothetical protein
VEPEDKEKAAARHAKQIITLSFVFVFVAIALVVLIGHIQLF